MTDLMCPSAGPDNGELVLGEGKPGRSLTYVEVSRGGSTAEADMETVRLAGACIKCHCVFWNERCELGKSIAQTATRLRLTQLPQCSIRRHCRWYAENGRSACGGCALVRYV